MVKHDTRTVCVRMDNPCWSFEQIIAFVNLDYHHPTPDWEAAIRASNPARADVDNLAQKTFTPEALAIFPAAQKTYLS